MLLLSKRISAKVKGPFGQTTSYTLYGDDQDENRYYILPEMPNFLEMPSGKPAFAMIWYYGSGTNAGGVCTFTVALQIPDLEDGQVKADIVAAISDDPVAAKRASLIFKMAQAHAAGNADAANQDRLALGLADKEAQALYAAYDAKLDYKQFLPSGESLKVDAVPVNTGSVTVRGFGGPDAFQNWKTDGDTKGTSFTGSYETTPSGLGDNAAVVSFDLTSEGANLFWHALGGPKFGGSDGPTGFNSEAANSVVAVEYTVSFDGMLPTAKATVTLHQSVVAEIMTEEKSKTDRWGHKKTWKEVVGKSYKKEIENSIKITLPSSSYLKGDEDSIEKMLNDWAQAQLENMLQSQLPEVKLDQLGTDKDAPKKLETVQDQTRTYELSQAIEMTVRPQGQLPMLNSLGVADLGEFFTTINLNDRPYFDVTIPVNPPPKNMMTDRGVRSLVVTQMTFADQVLRDGADKTKEVHTLTFSSDAATEQKELVGQFDRNKSDGVIDYSYMVTYLDGTPPLRMNNITVDPKTDGYNIILPSARLGVVYATLDGSFLPWGVIDRVRLDITYDDLFSETQLLTAEKQTAKVSRPIGKTVDKPLQYKATIYIKGGGAPLYYPIDGTSYESVDITSDSNVQVKSKLGSGGTQTYNFSLEGAASRALLKVQYNLPVVDGEDRVFNDTLSLDKDTPSVAWTVPTPAKGFGTFAVTKARTYDSEGEAHTPKIEPITTDGTPIEITVTLDDISGF